MDMDQFLNPDGFGDDLPCEMFQNTIDAAFLPQYAIDSKQEFKNLYSRPIEFLERDLGPALKIESRLNHQDSESAQKLSEVSTD